jgi:hypothetical protein
MSILKVKHLPHEMKEAIGNGLVFNDSGEDVSKTGEITHYDHNGDSENMLLCYRLFNADGQGVGFWLDETGDCVDSYEVE